MWKNYLKTAFRNIWRDKGYTFINVMGLSIGMAACIFIFIYIFNELKYDKWFDDHDRIFRVVVDGRISDDFFQVAVTSGPLAWNMKKDYPEIESVTRVHRSSGEVFLHYGDRTLYTRGLYYVDSTFFDVFSFPMLQGDPSRALDEPNSLVLSKEMAEKIFGRTDAMGEMIRMNDGTGFKVTGILDDLPGNTHLDFTMLASFSTLYSDRGRGQFEDWGSLYLYSYCKLSPGAVAVQLEDKFTGFVENYMEDLREVNIEFIPKLQKLQDIHLHSHRMAEISPNSDIGYVYAFSAIAIFILLIACINFMNLSTARSSQRSREVGMRKVVGALRRNLVIQFLGESVILGMIGLVIALLLVELFLPNFNELTGLNLSLDLGGAGYLWLLFPALVIFTGLVAGSYPAFYLSRFQPITVLKGVHSKGSGKSWLRSLLVIFQFSISIILIICTFIVRSQMEYMQSKKLGYDKENLLVIPLRGDRLTGKHEEIKAQLAVLPEIRSISASGSIPVNDLDGTGYIPEGVDDRSPWIIFTLYADHDYVETMAMEILSGRDFSEDFATDTAAVLINETLVRKTGWDDPLDKTIKTFGDTGYIPLKVIGVVKDFHFESLHDAVEPSMIRYARCNVRFLNIRLHPGDAGESIGKIKQRWEEIEPSYPFDYFFLDDRYGELYRSEEKMAQLFLYFTFLAILIACLGLLGLASFVAERRAKEIGIRKALGASTPSIVMLLSTDFSRWVLISGVVAWPVAYYFMIRWLETFAYRIDWMDHLWVFPAATAIALLVAWATVSYRSVMAALANPVEAIKYE